MFKYRQKKSITDKPLPTPPADDRQFPQQPHNATAATMIHQQHHWREKSIDKNTMPFNGQSMMKQHRQSPQSPPPLSPASSTSDTLQRTSAGSDHPGDQALSGWPPPYFKQRSKKEEEIRYLDVADAFDHPLLADTGMSDFTKGPPIIPRSRTPPPPQSQNDLQQQLEERQHSKKKAGTIFDSDDSDREQDYFFKDFSPDVSPRPKSKRYTKRQSENTPKKPAPKLDLVAFANHLHENRLSIVQVRQSNIRLNQEEEKELIRLLEKRKSMASSAQFTQTETPPLPEAAATRPNTETVTLDAPSRPLEKKPSALLQMYERSKNNNREEKLSPAIVNTDKRVNTKDGDTHIPRRSNDSDIRPTDNESFAKKHAERKRRLRKSISMDAIAQMAADVPLIVEPMNPIKENKEALNTVSPAGPSVSSPLDKLTPRPGKPAKAIGLFGSLRQASLNRSQGSLRGLVRSLSSAGYHRHRQQQAAEQVGSMSRAARAVMQHEAIEKQQRVQSEGGKKKGKEATSYNDSQKHNDERNGPTVGGNGHASGNLITTLLAKASKSKRTKKVNMENRGDKTKSRIVRRTIIYVPQDSSNFMKTLKMDTKLSAGLTRVPPMPTGNRYQPSANGKADDAPYYDDTSLYDYYRESRHLEGLELREMSDGTVEWGVLKKQGNRKSVYMPQNDPTAVEHMDDEDEDQIEERVLNMMGYNPDTITNPNAPPPVPRRSPRRQAESQHDNRHDFRRVSTIRKDTSTTDVYFAPQQTLPSLLQIIANSHYNDDDELMNNASVEEQLDMMIDRFNAS